MKIKKIVLNTLIIIFVAGIIYSIYHIIEWKINTDKNEKISKEIKQYITIEKEDETKEDKYKIDFKRIKNENSDAIAYIKVNNTNIEYVVVKTDNNDYYLKHNFNKEYNIAGWVFADYHNRFDETDKNIILYGHNMLTGTMFGTLKNTLTKEWQNNTENHKITLVTEKDTYYYEVFSTYIIKSEDYYIRTSFSSDLEFKDFITTLKSRSNYDFNKEVSEKDKIITLSSCTGDDTKRVVLHAKLITNENN